VIPGLDDGANARADERLRREREIWITTVRPDGQPQASPVGFLWDGASILVLSQPGSPKVRNLRGNPSVALNLEIDREDGASDSVLTIEGTATVTTEPIGEDEAAVYVARYEEPMRSAGLTPDDLFAEFSATIRVIPTRARLY
jgi:PPOX class probable F420-dependent enzyme